MRPPTAPRRRPQPGLGVEWFERRDAPAGVVGISTNAASRTVTVTGDQWGNGVQATRQMNTYVFTPVIHAGGQTSIHHQGRVVTGSVSIDASRFPNLRFDMLGGDDGIRLRAASTASRMQVAGTLQVAGGLGNDIVTIENVTLPGSVQIATSWGNDFINVQGTVFQSSSGVVIASGNDDDRVVICDVVSNPNCRVTVDLGTGLDELTVARSVFYSLLVDSGSTPRIIKTGYVPSLFVRG